MIDLSLNITYNFIYTLIVLVLDLFSHYTYLLCTKIILLFFYIFCNFNSKYECIIVIKFGLSILFS